MELANPLIMNKVNEFIAGIPMLAQMKLIKYAPLKADQITLPIMQEIAQIVGLKASESTMRSAAELVRADDADSLGDWLGQGENLQKFLAHIFSKEEEVTEAQVFDQDTGEVSTMKFVPTICPLCDGCFELPVA